MKKISREQPTQLAYLNLEDSKVYLQLKSNPFRLPSLVDGKKNFIIIDEIQRAPELLGEVHRMIEDQGKHFLLVANSAQRFQRRGAGLLKGTAQVAEFSPLTWFELQREQCFDLARYLRWGGLPLAYLNPDHKDRDDYLYHYIDTYIQEEIYGGAMAPTAQDIPNFVRFLEQAAQDNTQVVDYQQVARRAKLSVETVKNYYRTLRDTLMGFEVSPWRAEGRPQFYFFDPGVVHTLIGTQQLAAPSELYRRCFRQLIACELRAYLRHQKIPAPLQFWQSASQVNFVVGDQLAIQVDGPPLTQNQGGWKHLLVISENAEEKVLDNGVQRLHWQNFLHQLWRGQFSLS